MSIKKKATVFLFLLVLLVALTRCELFGPCGDVYFRDESPQDEEVMIPDCLGSRGMTNIKYDANGRIISYNFSVSCDGGKDYSGTVTFTRDASGNLISRTLIVNGKDCS